VKFTFPKGFKDLKPLQSALFAPVVTSAINETNIQRAMVQIFERIVKNGKVASARPGEASEGAHSTRLKKLLEDGHLLADDDNSALEFLDAWLEASVIRWIRASGSNELKIDFIRPNSAASYTSGFPTTRSRLRGIDQRVFLAMRAVEELRTQGAIGVHQLKEKYLLSTPLVDGLNFETSIYPYDVIQLVEDEDLDLTTSLTLKYLSYISPGGTRGDLQDNKSDLLANLLVFPNVNLPIGRDLLDLLWWFGVKGRPNAWTSAEILSGIETLVSLRMLQLPLRLGDQLLDLMSGRTETIEDFDILTNRSQMYFDFTSGRSSESHELSRISVGRDLVKLQNMFSDVVRLKVADRGLQNWSQGLTDVRDMNQQERLVYLAKVHRSDALKVKSLDPIDTIIHTLSNEMGEFELADYVKDKVQANGSDHFKTLVDLLLENHGKTVMDGYRKWFYSTGNIDASLSRRGVYFLVGAKSKSTTWKYEMSDEALISLVSMAFVPVSEREVALFDDKMLVTDLLERLKARFGVCIAEYQDSIDEIQTRRATSANLKGFLDRLRVLGCYEGLSDDLEAQMVSLPGSGTRKG
jgi:hypothetical protein